MIDYAKHSKVRSMLRRMWMFYDLDRKKALLRAKRRPGVWGCEQCEADTKKPQVDHVEAVGRVKPDVLVFFERLHCHESNLRILCKPCHDLVTKEQRNATRRRKVPGSIQKVRKNTERRASDSVGDDC